jgi:hypothetical protein
VAVHRYLLRSIQEVSQCRPAGPLDDPSENKFGIDQRSHATALQLVVRHENLGAIHNTQALWSMTSKGCSS